MPWNEHNYPPSMKHLLSEVRNKAIEIANALLEEGMEEGRAIPIATAQAKNGMRCTSRTIQGGRTSSMSSRPGRTGPLQPKGGSIRS